MFLLRLFSCSLSVAGRFPMTRTALSIDNRSTCSIQLNRLPLLVLVLWFSRPWCGQITAMRLPLLVLLLSVVLGGADFAVLRINTRAGFGAPGKDGRAPRAQGASREAGEGQEEGEPCLQGIYATTPLALARPRARPTCWAVFHRLRVEPCRRPQTGDSGRTRPDGNTALNSLVSCYGHGVETSDELLR